MNTGTLKITPEILSLILEIDEFKGAWRALGPAHSYEDSEIEGTHLRPLCVYKCYFNSVKGV